MVTLQTYLLYTLLFTTMLFLAKRASDKGEWFWMVLAILIYSIVFGMRYGVGVDHIGYLEDYQRLSFALDSQYDDTEAGFRFIRDTLARGGVHFAVYFGLIAFLQLFLVFKAVKKDKFIYPYLVISFFLGCIWLSYANGIRQVLSFAFFAYSLSFIENKKQLPIHYLLLLLALSMHNSAALLFIMAPMLLLKSEWFSNIKLQYILLVVALVVGRFPQMEAWLMSLEGDYGMLDEYMKETGYDGYFEYEDGAGVFRSAGTTGIGYCVELLRNIIIIWFSNAVKQYNSRSKVVQYMYNFTYIGILLHYAFIASPVISRINYYFYGFAYIFGAYTLHYLYNNNKKAFYIMLGLYVLAFIGIMYRMYDNTAAFYFFWQSDLYGK